jgi:hypothetical protein
MMKAIFILLIVLLFLFTSTAFARKMAIFPRHLVPNALNLDDHYIYITEDSYIYIYSAQDFKFLKRIGGKGEGPQEFKGSPQLLILADQLLVNSQAKVSFFKKDGVFVREFNNIVSGQTFKPLDDRFIGRDSTPEKDGQMYAYVNIYDPSFNKVKSIYRTKSIVKIGKGWWLFARTYFKFVVLENKIFIAGDTEFVIEVFKAAGNRLPPLKQEYQRVKFTDRHRRKVLNYYRMNPSTKAEYNWWEKNIHFPDYFPAIRDMIKADNNIYVRTYKEQKGRSEFFIFSNDGKLIRRVFLPIAESNAKLAYPYMRDSAPFAIYGEKLYQLITDDDAGDCELQVFDIE